MRYSFRMQKTKGKKESKEKKEQDALLKSFLGTVHHFFGSWDTIFGSVFDVRKKHLIKYSVAELLCTGVLMFVFHLKSRRQIAYKLGKNEMSEEKFKELLEWGKCRTEIL